VAVKDMGLILERAKQLSVPLPVGGLYQTIAAPGPIMKDGISRTRPPVMKIYEKLAGISRGGQAGPQK